MSEFIKLNNKLTMLTQLLHEVNILAEYRATLASYRDDPEKTTQCNTLYIASDVTTPKAGNNELNDFSFFNAGPIMGRGLRELIKLEVSTKDILFLVDALGERLTEKIEHLVKDLKINHNINVNNEGSIYKCENETLVESLERNRYNAYRGSERVNFNVT